MTHFEGAVQLTDCRCLPSFFSKSRLPGTKCEACPGHGVCAGKEAWPHPSPGFWGNASAPFAFSECFPARACVGGTNFT